MSIQFTAKRSLKAFLKKAPGNELPLIKNVTTFEEKGIAIAVVDNTPPRGTKASSNQYFPKRRCEWERWSQHSKLCFSI